MNAAAARLIATGALTVAALGLVGCTSSVPVALPLGAAADYQLGGASEPPAGVEVVARDSSEDPAPGLYNICYVNGYQTQPEDTAEWIAQAPDLVLHDPSGSPVFDPAWPDEAVLDVSTGEQRARIIERLLPAIERCAEKGFDAVEFDNLDTFARFPSLIDERDAVELAKLLVASAHEHGLAAGQKNTPQLGAAQARAIGFDFAVAEECVRFEECTSYTEVYGEQVIDIEYDDDLRDSWADTCAEPSRPTMTVLRDRDLVRAGTEGYRFATCDEAE